MDQEYTRKKILELLSHSEYRPMTMNEMAGALDVPIRERSDFFRLLQELEKDGTVTVSKAKKMVQVNRHHYRTASLLTITKKGAFAALSDKSGDIFIQKDKLKDAMPTDVITVRLLKKGGRLPEGEVVKVVERKFSEFTGTLHKHGKRGYIIADSGLKEKIEVSAKDLKLAKDGDKVFARVKKYPGRDHGLIAQILTSYGSAASAAACTDAVLDRMHVRREFPEAALSEAQEVSKDIQVDKRRLDLRDRPIFTIDGADAKDLDDAVSVEKTEKGYRLGVHIADVSHYVKAGSELDKEAFKRGTSIYYAASVIPMLPKELSNGICSLNPQEDRLTFSCFMDIDLTGKILNYEIKKSVIRSRVKGVYREVNEIFEGSAGEELLNKYKEVLPELKSMRELADVLRSARMKRGALDIETDDSQVIVGEDGVAKDVKKRERGEAEKLIEEFMLCANESVATFADIRNVPFVYRIHEEPDPRKLEDLAAAVRAAGIDTRMIRAGLRPGDMSGVLKTIASSPKSKALNELVLRSLAKARYSPECVGHFGLALSHYSHFTSPIRRYPDLAIHRILTDMIENGMDERLTKRYKSFSEEASRVSSEREIAAMQLEWECDAIYKAEYMSFHIGEQFTGMVSSVKPFGMYVELENSVEGMVRVEALPGGWYDYDENTLTLSCKKSGMRFSVGDSVRVIVSRADVASGQIDFDVL